MGKFRLLPFIRGKEPFGRGKPQQRSIDSVFSMFRHLLGTWRQVDYATVVQLGTGELIRHLQDKESAQALQFSDLLAMAGLSSRRAFDSTTYCNRDGLQVYVVRGDPKGQHWSTISRRVDGAKINIEPRRPIDRPAHVEAPTFGRPIDWNLLESLLSLLTATRL